MRTLSDLPDFQHCKNHLISRGEHFSSMSLKSRQKISEFGDQFIQDNSVILVHGRSRVVLGILAQAVKKGKIFSVIVTEGRPCEDGEFVSKELNKLGIPVSSVLDAAVAAKIHQVDFILFGAEAVVESGGVINSIGTYQISIVAKSLNKPVYVAVESYKFARLFPLTQTDIPQVIQRKDSEIPCDYTPPKYITLLFTDLGILTPSAVSDELIKLYY